MTTLIRAIVALTSRRVPIQPRLCLWCERWITSISRSQWDAMRRDGHITCTCGVDLRTMDEVTAP